MDGGHGEGGMNGDMDGGHDGGMDGGHTDGPGFTEVPGGILLDQPDHGDALPRVARSLVSRAPATCLGDERDAPNMRATS